MRLICSKNNNISIGKLWEQAGCIAVQNPADVIRKQPQIAFALQKEYDLLSGKSVPKDRWQKFMKEFFLSKVTGSHTALRGIFSPLTEYGINKCFVGNHVLSSVLGIGTDACTYKTADGCCLKVAEMSGKEKLHGEYEILRRLKHKNVVRCFDFISEDGYAAILMELLTPELGLEESYIEGLMYCHNQDILHGDIRLNNLGTDSEGNAKLFDFGNAAAGGSEEEMQFEITLLKHAMRSPAAQMRKIIVRE